MQDTIQQMKQDFSKNNALSSSKLCNKEKAFMSEGVQRILDYLEIDITCKDKIHDIVEGSSLLERIESLEKEVALLKK